MKTALKIILILGAIGYIIFAIVKFARPSDERICQAVNVFIEDSISGEFVTEDYVLDILQRHKISAEGQKINKINILKLEELLEKDPYIASATCYYTAGSYLSITVLPQHPVLRVIAENGENYYMDTNGNIMPTDKFNINLCVFTGKISKEFAKRKLIPVALYINKNGFWNKQVEQIHVVNEEQVEIYPRVGKHTILLGSTENFRDKLDRMYIFYRNGLPKVGWNKYETINLAYNGQIVCTKKNNKR